MNQNTNVNLIPKFPFSGNLYFSQYDVGRVATINLVEDGAAYTIPSGATVKIQATKPSGLGFSVDCTYSGSVVTVVSTETMTNEYGRFPCELRIESGDVLLGTTNFTFNVEKSPHPTNTVDGDSEDIINQITVALNNALSDIQEAKEEAIEEISQSGGGITEAVKVALLNCFAHTAWIDGNGQTYYDALEDALYPPANLVSISVVYTQSGTVYTTDTLDSLKSDLVVTAHYSDSTTSTVASADYTLSGTLVEGTSTITVAYGGKITTFDVTVTEAPTNYNMNYLFSDLTLSDGYIGDDGNVVSLANNVFLDEMIKAKGFWLAGSNGVYYNDNHVFLRIAEYDSNGDFVGRKAVQQGSAAYGKPALADSGEFIKMGTNSYTDYVTQNADRFVACNILDTSICTIANKTIDTNGDVQDASESNISDFLPINQGYMICQTTANTETALVVFYNSNHELISRHGVTGTLTNRQLFVQVPNNAAYVRFRCPISATSDIYVSYAM